MALTKSQMVFQSAFRLSELKAGDVVTEQQIEAIYYFLGDLIGSVRKMPMQEIRIEFPNGEPTITKNETGIDIEIRKVGSDEEIE